jgi:hypothetical protein
MKVHRYPKKGYPFCTANTIQMRKAVQKLCRAVDSGKLIRPSECSMCGVLNTQIIGHHEDYDKPLEVIWVCLKCHRKIHTLRHYLALEA